jgi:hypothetical protein
MARFKKEDIVVTVLLIADIALCGWVIFANFPDGEKEARPLVGRTNRAT